MKVTFCSSCSQVVNSCYLHCPYCGHKLQIKKDLIDMVAHSLSSLEQQELNRHLYSLRKLLCCLVLVEEELDLFIQQKDGLKKELHNSSVRHQQTF